MNRLITHKVKDAFKLYRPAPLKSKTVPTTQVYREVSVVPHLGCACVEEALERRDEFFGLIAMDPVASTLNLHALDAGV